MELDGAFSPISWVLPIQKAEARSAASAALSSGYTAPVVPVCTLTPNICWSWRRSRKDWNMEKFFVVKSVNPLKSGYSKRPANNVTWPVNQYWEEDHQRCCRGGTRRFRGFNPPPPLGCQWKCGVHRKCYHVFRPTQY